MYEVGSVVTKLITVRDDAGALASATVSVVITLPDGTTTSPSVTNPATGSYKFTYKTLQAGRHPLMWTAATIAGVSGSDQTVQDEFDVSDALGPLASLSDAKAFLNISSGDTTNDDEIQSFLDVASSAVESWCGRSFRRQTYAETVNGGFYSIALRHLPIISVTSVTENGTTLTAADYRVNGQAGTLDRLYGSYAASCWSYGVGNVTVTYVVGYTDIPDDVSQACLLLLDHLWDTQRGSRENDPFDSADVAGSAWTWPHRVTELLGPWKMSGFA